MDGFVLYLKKKSLFDKLSDADAGRLIKAIYTYQTDGTRPTDTMTDLLLEDFIVVFTQDKEKHSKFVESRRAAAMARWGREKESPTKPKSEPQGLLFSDATPAITTKPKAKAFVPPTVEEVQAYCVSRHNGIDAQYFWDYQTARNWVYKGNVKMKDWKAAVRTWERNGVKGSSTTAASKPQITGNQKSDIFTIMDYLNNGNN